MQNDPEPNSTCSLCNVREYADGIPTVELNMSVFLWILPFFNSPGKVSEIIKHITFMVSSLANYNHTQFFASDYEVLLDLIRFKRKNEHFPGLKRKASPVKSELVLQLRNAPYIV